MIEEFAPDDHGWGAALAQVPHSCFHTSLYAKAWAAEQSSPVRLFVLRRADGIAMAPLMLRRAQADPSGATWDALSPYGFPGPLFQSRANGQIDDLVDDFCDRLCNRLRELGCASLFVRLQPLAVENAAIERARATLFEQGLIVYVDLTGSMEAVRSGYRSNHRRDIRRLAGAGYEAFQLEKNWASVFYDVYSETMRRNEARSFYFFTEQMFHALEELGDEHLYCVGCRRGSEIASVALITRGGDVANYFLGGTREAFLKDAPSKLAFDHAFALEHARGARSFVLGAGLGSTASNSLFNFKRGFSSLVAPYFTWREIIDPDRYHRLVAATGAEAQDLGVSSLSFPPYNFGRRQREAPRAEV